jgi:hypothetical protein
MIRLTLLLFISLSSAATLADSNIVKWVDDQGVTHFGNRQFAPPERHDAVTVKAVNGMAVPESTGASGSYGSGPRVITLARSKLKNKRGFRGYGSRPSARQRYRRR